MWSSLCLQMSQHLYCQNSNINRTLIGNKIVDHSDVVGASPAGAAPTTSSFSTWHLASMDWAKTTARWDEKRLSLGFGVTYIRGLTVGAGTSADTVMTKVRSCTHLGPALPGANETLNQDKTEYSGDPLQHDLL